MENNFERHIRDSMNTPPDFPFDEQRWKDMEIRLDQQSQRKPAFGYLSLLPFLLMALITSGLAAYFYIKQYKATERIAILEQQMLDTKAISSKSTVEQRVTIIYDTIYRRVEVNDRIILAAPSVSRSPSTRRSFASQSFVWDLEKEDLAGLKYEDLTSIQRYLKTKAWGLSSRREDKATSPKGEEIFQSNFDWSQAADILSSLPNHPLDVKRMARMPALHVTQHKTKRRVRFYLDQLRPTRFALAGTTGTFASLNLGGSGFNLRGSAQAELGMGNRFSITAGIEYFSNDFGKRNEENAVDFLEGFPNLPPSNEEDMLIKIQGDFNYLQLPFGVKYIVFPQRSVYPYLGIGLIAGKATRSRLEYEYLSNTGIYTISEGQLLPRLFELNALYNTIGVQVRMNKNWSLVLEGSAQFDIKKGTYKYENLELLKFNTGVQYQF